MPNSLVQHAGIGHTTAGNSDSVNATFGSDTVQGNFLVCVVSAYFQQSTTSGVVGTISGSALLSTPGVVWVLAASAQFKEQYTLASGYIEGQYLKIVSIYYAANAPSISHLTSTTLSATGASSIGVLTNSNTDVTLLEVSGSVALLDTVASASLSNNAHYGIGATLITAGNLASSGNDLVIVAAASFGNTMAAGTGYIALGNNTNISYENVQYILNAPAGLQSTSWSGGSTSLDWACVAVSFTGAALSPRSSGFLFGF